MKKSKMDLDLPLRARFILRQERRMEQIDTQLADIPVMYLLSERKMVMEQKFSEQYKECYGNIFQKITFEGLRMAAPPMVLFYVNREKRLAVSILSSFMPRPKDRIEFIHQYVEPIFGDES